MHIELHKKKALDSFFVHNINTTRDVRNIFGCMYLLRSTCAESSFAYSLVLNPRETRDSGVVVVLDFKKKCIIGKAIY